MSLLFLCCLLHAFLLLVGCQTPRRLIITAMYSLMINLGDGLVESLALGLGELQLKRRGLARAVRSLFVYKWWSVGENMFLRWTQCSYSKGPGTPGTTATSLVEVG